MIKCLIGGGNLLSDELADPETGVARYIKPTDKLVVIPFATEEHKYDRWFQSVVDNYERLGLTDFHLVRYDDSPESIQEAIQSAQVIFLAGGYTERLLQRLEEKGASDLIRNFTGVLIGYSAGALIMCKDAITTKDDDYPETIVDKGLDIVDFSVEVHYTERVDQDLFTLSHERIIYAMPDGSAILVDESNCPHFINTVHTFAKGEKQ